MESDFNKIFYVPTNAMKICRIHPYMPKDKRWAIQFFITQGLYTLIFLNVIYNTFAYDLKANDFSQICKNGVLVILYSVVTFQYSVLLLHKDALLELIRNMNKDYEQSKNLDLEERDVMNKYLNQSVWVCKQWLILTIFGTFIFVVKSLTLCLYYYCINEFRLVPYYDLVFPPFIERNKDKIHGYLAAYMLMFFYASYCALMYAAFVPLGPIFMLHACGQLELVKKRIDKMFVECDDQVIRRELTSIIVQLQYIYSFVDNIKKIFKLAYEVTLKGTTILLPVTCYEVLEALHRGEVSLEFVTFIIGGTLISSSPCYYSDLLMDKGEEVRIALYTCGWEQHYDHSTRTTLILMLQQALKPAAIKTLFRTLCLEALTDLFQQSYAIFNLMNAMWD